MKRDGIAASLLGARRTKEVKVNRTDLTLTEPDSQAMLLIRTELTNFEADAACNMRAKAMAVAFCLPDEELTQMEAVRLIAIAGGEASDLATKAMELAGFPQPKRLGKAADAPKAKAEEKPLDAHFRR